MIQPEKLQTLTCAADVFGFKSISISSGQLSLSMCLGPMVRGRVPRHAGRNGGYRNRQAPVLRNGNRVKL